MNKMQILSSNCVLFLMCIYVKLSKYNSKYERQCILLAYLILNICHIQLKFYLTDGSLNECNV